MLKLYGPQIHPALHFLFQNKFLLAHKVENIFLNSTLEVSLIIRFSIPEAAFEVDFFILLSPKMNILFILAMR